MAHQRRSPSQRTCSTTTEQRTPPRKSYPLRQTHSRTSSHGIPRYTVPSEPPPTRNPLRSLVNLNKPPQAHQFDGQPEKEMVVRASNHSVQVGAKRKRVASSNENTHYQGRTRRTQKRNRTSTTLANRYSSTSEEFESDGSDMEIDQRQATRSPVHSDSEEDQDNDDDDVYSDDDRDPILKTDNYYLMEASYGSLKNLKKAELARLYRVGRFADDPELLTKAEIIEVIIDKRNKVKEEEEVTHSSPPSSPPVRTDYGSGSDEERYPLSDDGNAASDEAEHDVDEPEDDLPKPRVNGGALPRRGSTNNAIMKMKPTPLGTKGRSVSMGTIVASSSKPGVARRDTLPRIDIPSASRSRRSGNRSSPSASATQSAVSQKTLRSRKISAPTPVALNGRTLESTSSSSRKGKGKSKHVEFKDELPQPKTSSRRRSKEKARESNQVLSLGGSDSELTELEELDRRHSLPQLQTTPQPSPRRLRSKDRGVSRVAERDQDHADAETTPTPKRKAHVRGLSRSSDEHQEPESVRPTRVVPTRRAKVKIKSLRESDLEMGSQSQEDEEEDELDGEEEEVDEEEGEEEEEAQVEEGDGEEDGEEEGEGEDEDEDEEGDEGEEEDEEEGGELEVDSVEEVDEVDELISTTDHTPPPSARSTRRTPLRQRLRHQKDAEEENEGDDELEVEGNSDAAEGSEVAEDDEETIAVEEPRRLRNGKIVGDEDVHMEEDEDEEAAEEEGGDDDDVSVDEHHDEALEDIELEHEDDGEVTDDDVDLTVATAKTLTRLRKDDLVRLCESRNLEPVGNKRKLAEALLQWRDRHANDFSSPSSTGTVRAASLTARRGRKKRSSATTATPVLERPSKDQIHTDEPRTPVPGSREKDDELELDLESLGLEDREIPPEKIVKLEKIGSGGFKDVFIGKFKGRRIAISEFRGTLSAMDIKELKLLGGFDHPNIVRFLGVSIPENTKETPVMIVSELCSNGDLFDYIRNVNAPSLHKVLRIMCDIASGLEYLHTRTPSVIHRDCKSSNILITAKGTAKIADFGLAKVKESTRSMVRSLVGTVNWQAPELWTAHPNYNHKVDVFSCAMVFWEMLQWHIPNKKFPWEGMNEHAIYEAVGSKKQRPSIAGLRKHWCPEIVDLVERMWAQEPRERPTMTEVVNTLRDLVNQY